jgi:hypothetical protein
MKEKYGSSDAFLSLEGTIEKNVEFGGLFV